MSKSRKPQSNPDELNRLNLLVDIWCKAVETQMHFNEMSVKSRQFGLTFVAAALGIGMALLTKGEEFSLRIHFCSSEIKLHAAVALMLAGALAMAAVKILDLKVYHQMLRGAVTFGEDLEKNGINKLTGLNTGMTEAISHFSRMENASVDKSGGAFKYSGDKAGTAQNKIAQFYNWSIIAMVVAAIFTFLATL